MESLKEDALTEKCKVSKHDYVLPTAVLALEIPPPPPPPFHSYIFLDYYSFLVDNAISGHSSLLLGPLKIFL